MTVLIFAVTYLVVCYGGRILLRGLRSNRDIMLHLRASQKTTLTAVLLGVSLRGVFQGLLKSGSF